MLFAKQAASVKDVIIHGSARIYSVRVYAKKAELIYSPK